MESNDRVGISILQPRLESERVGIARKCCAALEMSMPLLVDEIDDRVGHLYSGMPDRLYLIDRDGRVVYKGGRGPFGFKVRELEQSMIMLQLDQAPLVERTGHGVPLPSQAESWKRLPPAERGAGQTLPAWARALASRLPRTTAAMLELDYLQRSHSPLDPKLGGKMRWVAAHANRCVYAQRQAAADLRRLGASESEIRALASDFARLAAPDRQALEFARDMTLAANRVSDEQVAGLVRRYGDRQVVAMVLLLAYANFQDRLLLTLGISQEPNGPLPPLDIRFARPKNETSAGQTARQTEAAAQGRAGEPKAGDSGKGAVAAIDDPERLGFDFSHLQANLERQRARQPRIRVPSFEEVRPYLPASYPKDRVLRIRWSLVCLGYQPELAGGWSACMRTFAEEAKQDRVFEESLFWVVTRALECFY
jgi:alkylhydroperoxidase family enzyme